MNPELSTVNDRTATLIRKHLLSSLSASEHAELAEWIDEDPINKKLFIQVGLRYRKDLELEDRRKKETKEKASFLSFLKELFA